MDTLDDGGASSEAAKGDEAEGEGKVESGAGSTRSEIRWWAVACGAKGLG